MKLPETAKKLEMLLFILLTENLVLGYVNY